ncbi:MAG: hypothetical protein GYA24_09420 [Candidatus Lokiarchaeota archaeon]|nr:hypothetical protein [Candidatus Lokiarchaeota archaeon]
MTLKEHIRAVFTWLPRILRDEAHRVTWKELPPVTDEEIAAFDRNKVAGFDRVGYARPLGGWLYQFFYAILGAGVMAVLIPVLLGTLYPEPESKAYVTVAGVLFSIFQNAMNVPTAWAIERWIGDYRIKNPKKMLEFISFYIWYQMTSGLAVITTTSIYTILVVVNGNMAHLTWIILLLMTREYPAMLNVFLQTIKGLQKFDYESKCNFVNEIINKLFEFIFVLLGRYWIGSNPAIGNLLGTAIGFVIGTYLNQFGEAILAGWYLSRALRPMGLRLRDAVRPNFSWDTVKRSVLLGFQLSFPGLVATVVGFFVFFSWYDAVPAYATMLTLNSLADEIANISKRSEGINTKGAFAEALNNGKQKLGQYYIANTFKYYGFFTVGIACLVIGYMPTVISVMLVLGGAENYLLAIPFILPNILRTLIEQPEGEADKILTMAHKPVFKTVMGMIHLGLGYFMTFFYLVITRWPQTYGLAVMIWIIPCGNLIADLIRFIASWWYINKYICKIKIAWWQSFVAPLIPGALTLIEGMVWATWVFPELSRAIGSIPAVIISVTFAMVVGLIFNFVILYGAFGGWDDHTLGVFKEAVYISGPSRIFFIPVYKMTAALVKISKLHNRFPMDHEAAEREMIELMIQRQKNEQHVAKETSSPGTE